MIAGLQELHSNHTYDAPAIIRTIQVNGLGVDPQLAEEPIEDIKAAIAETITQLQAYDDPTIEINSPSSQPPETPEETYKNPPTPEQQAIIDQNKELLKEISEGQFLDAEVVKSVLENLAGVTVEIPIYEINRLNAVLAQPLPEDVIKKAQTLRNLSEHNQPPLIIQLPCNIIIDGQEEILSPATLGYILEKGYAGWVNPYKLKDDTRKYDTSKKLPYHSPFKKPLYFFGTAHLKDTLNKPYKQQVQAQTAEDTNFSTGDELITALMLYRLATGTPLLASSKTYLNNAYYHPSQPEYSKLNYPLVNIHWDGKTLVISHDTSQYSSAKNNTGITGGFGI